jgi:hypothetical protein
MKNQPASPASQPSQQPSSPAAQPASQQASKPASQQASKPASQQRIIPLRGSVTRDAGVRVRPATLAAMQGLPMAESWAQETENFLQHFEEKTSAWNEEGKDVVHIPVPLLRWTHSGIDAMMIFKASQHSVYETVDALWKDRLLPSALPPLDVVVSWPPSCEYSWN